MSGSSMLPDPPPPQVLRDLGIRASETHMIGGDEVWWRAHHTQGEHVLAWNAFRAFGPLLRFDPHPLPRGEYPQCGVWYAASSPRSAVGDRFIDRDLGHPYLTGLSFTRMLTVLDLAPDCQAAWVTRVGGTFAISTAPHAVTQRWARHIVDAFPDLDGLRYNCRFGQRRVALFAPAASAIPQQPLVSLPLTHPDIASRITGFGEAPRLWRPLRP